MARELTQRGNIVGSAGYFAELNGNGLLKQIMRPQYSVRYEECIKDTARKVNTAVRTVLDDLKAHASVLYFMERSDLSRMEKAIDQLERFCTIAGERLSDASDCRDYLRLNHRDTHLKSRASQRDLDDAMDILRGHGSYDLSQSRERILAELIRDGSHSEAYRYGKDGLRFAEDLMGRNGFDQIKDLYRMWQYRNEPRRFHGRWGYAIGTEQYLDALGNAVFGSGFRSDDLSKGNHNYGDSLAEDLKKLAGDFSQDVTNSPQDEFIIYDNRQRMLEAAEQLERLTRECKKYSIERQLKLYQRLEDFNNRVIEFDVRGKTTARMAWENGKNILYIDAAVCFILDDSALASQKITVRDGFKKWAGQYTVFGGQSLEVKIDIHEKSSITSAYPVFIRPDTFDGNSVSWGGTPPRLRDFLGVNIIDIAAMARGKSNRENYRFIFDWDPEAWKAMYLGSTGITEELAMHEFGHWLGLQDAYVNDNMKMPGPIKGMWPLSGVQKGVYPDYDSHGTAMESMKLLKPPSNNDMEMVVLAFHTGQRQNYQVQFPWEKISEAMGRGN